MQTTSPRPPRKQRSLFKARTRVKLEQQHVSSVGLADRRRERRYTKTLGGRPILLLAGIVLVAACGDDDDTASTTSVTTSSSMTTGTTSITTGTTQPTSTTEADDDVPYVPWGPDDPLIPDQYGALSVSSSSALDCTTVEQNAPNNDFWSTVIEVCYALRGDRPWPTDGVIDPPEAPNDFQACLNSELATMLRDLFTWLTNHPGDQPDVAYPPGKTRSPCELQIYHVARFEVPASEDHPTGGIVVELQVPGLIEDAPDPNVRIDGQPATVDHDFSRGNDGLSLGAIYIPAPIEAHTATIEVDTYFATLSTAVELPSVDGSGTTTQPSDSVPDDTDSTTNSTTTSTATQSTSTTSGSS